MAKAFVLALILGASGAATPALAVRPEVAAAAAESSGLDMDKTVCRRESVIGSRAQTRKTCKTRRQWAKDSDAARNGWGETIRSAKGALSESQ